MESGGSHLGKTPACQNFSTGQVGVFPICLKIQAEGEEFSATNRNPAYAKHGRGDQVGHNTLNYRKIAGENTNGVQIFKQKAQKI